MTSWYKDIKMLKQDPRHSAGIEREVAFSLINHVYNQTISSLLASLACACLIWYSIYDTNNDNHILMLWISLMFIVTVARIFSVYMFSIDKSVRQHVRLWKSVFIAGSFLGGICWGLPGFLLFPGATVTQQELMILMLAGISAGAVPLSAALPEAAITFLITSITPYLITIYTLHQSIFVLFLFALTLYLIFMISLSLGTYKMIKNSMILKYEKDVLLHKIKKSNKMLQKSATHDPLTKIANRILFEESLNKLITTSSALHTEFALMFIDLDQFKLINDIYGHEIGDIILINTTEKIKQCIHPDDIIARLGGDEIAVIVKKLVESEYLEKVATCICNVINQPVEIKNHTIHISASIGISKFPHDGVDREELLRVADKRMYRSKSFGGNRVTFSDSTKEDLVDHS